MTYRVILADPPWQFRVWNKDTGAGRSAESHYPTMDIDSLCAMKPPADKNAALFMWAVWPSLPDAIRLMQSWGFEYKTVAFVWVKMNKSGIGTFVGMGYYTRANTEPCLLGVRGSMPVSARNVQALIMSPVREHSRKPDEQYKKIERLYPTGPYLEMFARHKHPGWHSFGNEIQSDVIVNPNGR